MKPEVARKIYRFFGAAGILLLLAGPAFHLLPSQPALFAGIACFVVSGVVMGILRGRGGGGRDGEGIVSANGPGKRQCRL